MTIAAIRRRVGARRHSPGVFAVTALALASSSLAQPISTQTWAGTPAGTYSVGFSVVVIDADRPRIASERALLWRPIRQAGAALRVDQLASMVCGSLPEMTAKIELTACFPDLASAVKSDRGGTSDAVQREDLGKMRLHASAGGTPAAGRFPLVIAMGSIASRGAEFVALAEMLSSRGHIVAEVVPPHGSRSPSEATRAQRQLARTLSVLTRDPGVDAQRLGLVAWSFGGVPAALEAASNTNVRAIVSLDSALRYQYGVDMIEATPTYRPTAFRGRLLSIAAGIENAVPKSNRALRALEHARVEEIIADGLRHADFSDQHGALPSLVRPQADRQAFQRHHARLLGRVAATIESALAK